MPFGQQPTGLTLPSVIPQGEACGVTNCRLPLVKGCLPAKRSSSFAKGEMARLESKIRGAPPAEGGRRPDEVACLRRFNHKRNDRRGGISSRPSHKRGRLQSRPACLFQSSFTHTLLRTPGPGAQARRGKGAPAVGKCTGTMRVRRDGVQRTWGTGAGSPRPLPLAERAARTVPC